MSQNNVRLDFAAGNVATITITRPHKLNALTGEAVDDIRAAVEEVGRSDARCLIITGEGRGFSAGADLSTGGGLPEDAGAALEKHFNPMVNALFDLPMPVIAAVNGPAAGAGASLALLADLVIAARSAYFQLAFVNIGLVPDAGATWLLPRLIGRSRAMEMMMLGERVEAVQAADWGLVHRVVDDPALMDEALKLARRLAAGPTRALALTRKMMRESAELPLAHALEAERRAQREAGDTQDFKAGVAAFLSKQKPSFQGR